MVYTRRHTVQHYANIKAGENFRTRTCRSKKTLQKHLPCTATILEKTVTKDVEEDPNLLKLS